LRDCTPIPAAQGQSAKGPWVPHPWFEADPAFQGLTGLQEVNYHTLADFRVEKQKELDELFTQVLAALSKERLKMQSAARVALLALRRQSRRLPNLLAQTGVLSGQ
jgi:hypothetical protein